MKKLNKILRNNFIFYSLVSILVLLIIYTLIPIPNAINQLNEVKILNKKELEKQKELQLQLEILNNPELQTDIAREQYKISKEGEILFVFPEENGK